MNLDAKQDLWNVLSAIKRSGKTIFFSSNSMDECESLCTRLAIMVDGEFKCIGSTQHLRNKFTSGFWLKLKISKTSETE